MALEKSDTYYENNHRRHRDAYEIYLRSDKWQKKRQAVIERQKGICQGCESEPIEEIHHLTYTHKYNELLFQLVGLCATCHNNLHFVGVAKSEYEP